MTGGGRFAALLFSCETVQAAGLEFWKEQGEVLAAGLPYHEVAPQLVLMAYLQRVVNGGG